MYASGFTSGMAQQQQRTIQIDLPSCVRDVDRQAAAEANTDDGPASSTHTGREKGQGLLQSSASYIIPVHNRHHCGATAHHGAVGNPRSQHGPQTPSAASHPCPGRSHVRIRVIDEASKTPNLFHTPHTHREAYSMEHVHRLLTWEARTPWTGSKCSVYCNQQHVQPCHACTTCHFCRQKTVDKKTTCSRCGRGHWCAACLYERAGQHIGVSTHGCLYLHNNSHTTIIHQHHSQPSQSTLLILMEACVLGGYAPCV